LAVKEKKLNWLLFKMAFYSLSNFKEYSPIRFDIPTTQPNATLTDENVYVYATEYIAENFMSALLMMRKQHILDRPIIVLSTSQCIIGLQY